ncbi:MAG: hypothetical protein J6584_00095 [Lactobacillus sp.]|uniref:Uncharacterized protein n=1 Tax=Bombilactobacillus bombi TaxID=1303590 RepID=A0A347STP5_9LACO|nr:hypothetical protein [Bombilactobacillus bombi]AXX65404.1 hypothetical protein DS830_07860 [Bombilactobacillus bombi]MCO6542367.1 hypothetical protein [Lactobacillus sp.]RHW52194.1 hypothetical protein DS831_02385 [Bombilactobacillus bombi]
MADLFDGKRNLVLGAEYNTDYQTLQKAHLELNDSFFLAVMIGYRNQQKIPSNIRRGLEFNSLAFSPVQKELLYGLILSWKNMDLQTMVDNESINQIYEKLIAYANGGLQWLRGNIFPDYLDADGAIVADPSTILLKLNEMIAEEVSSNKAPF